MYVQGRQVRMETLIRMETLVCMAIGVYMARGASAGMLNEGCPYVRLRMRQGRRRWRRLVGRASVFEEPRQPGL